MEISKFLNEQYSDSALYMNYRSTPSYIDGLKNAARKVIYTIKKNNLKQKVKVSALASKVVDSAGYLHGDTSIQGTIVTMAQNYCGSNNLPTIEGVGAFGTRHTPEAAAPRYIFAQPSFYFDFLFKKEDDYNLIEQEFEGEKIEPVYYVPTLPMLLVNGSTGIGVGFSANIISRDLKNVINIVRNSLTGKKSKEELFKPSWKGFVGSITKITDNKWEIRGHISNIKKKTVVVDELPISYTLTSYLALLKKLKEKGVVDKWIDYSENDKFKFEITLTEVPKSIEDAMIDLKLIESITENLVCIDENNAIREFNSVEEIYDAYYKIKIKSLEKRLKSEIERLKAEEEYCLEVTNFITEVVKGFINIKAKRAELEKQLKERKFKHIDKLVSLPIYSLTVEKAEELNNRYLLKKKERENMEQETPITLWSKDLDELEKNIMEK